VGLRVDDFAQIESHALWVSRPRLAGLARSGANSQACANCSAGIILDELETGTVSEATMERIRAMLGGEDEDNDQAKAD
jgi:hypothetical protein